MDGFLQDCRFGLRVLRKNPGMTAISVLALAVGIGLTATMYSIVYGAMWRGLPFEEQERIIHLERANPERGIDSTEVTIHDFVDWRAQQASFVDLAAFYDGTVNVSGDERPERYNGAFMTASSFDLLRVQPQLGRLFTEAEESPEAPSVIVIGDHVWRDRYDRDPGVVGRTLRVNGEQATIIGVMPEGFRFPILQDVWVPLRLDPVEIPRGEGTTLEVFGRLRDGVSLEEAGAEFAAISARLEAEYPETNEGYVALMKPFIVEFLGEDAPPLLLTMLGGVFFVLLIACANVANLQLSRAIDRTKEVAIRSALGARRWRVLRQLLVEVFLVALAGAGIGLVLAAVGVDAFNRSLALADEVPFFIVIKLDLPVFLFVMGVTLLATLLAGVLPGLQATRSDVAAILQDEARGSSGLRIGRLSKALVVGQVALSCGLLVGAGLMIKSVTKLAATDFGFPRGEILTARIGLFETDYPDAEARVRFYDDLLEKLRAQPAVRSAALTTALPGTGYANWWRMAIEGEAYAADTDHPLSRVVSVSPGFFETIDAQVLQGRALRDEDDADAPPVAVINRAFAERYFPDGNPVGRRLRLGGAESERPWRTVVGVVPDLWITEVELGNVDGIYVPLEQLDSRFFSVTVRTRGAPLEQAGMLRETVTSIDRDLPIYWVMAMESAILQETWFYWVFGSIFMVMGGVALFLAGIGLYGVMSFSVARRTPEVGIRMALGAGAPDVLRLVVRQGLWQLGVGLALGLAFAYGVSRLLGVLLFQVDPQDPVVFVGIAAVLLIAGLLACIVPARRASRVDPVLALRTQ